jgi:hypothetical protein
MAPKATSTASKNAKSTVTASKNVKSTVAKVVPRNKLASTTDTVPEPRTLSMYFRGLSGTSYTHWLFRVQQGSSNLGGNRPGADRQPQGFCTKERFVQHLRSIIC